MAPIRVGIIGLSTSAKTSWASSAHLPYLKAATDKYQIVALCNSSVESAQKSISQYGLSPSTKAYGDTNDLAKDPDVDLVVCSVRVDRHLSTTRPSIEAGKDVFVEWPLASNVDDAKTLADLARQKNVRCMVGLQGRTSPVLLRVKSLIESGKIGKLLSSSVVASGITRTRDNVPEGLRYFMDKKVGGNFVTIGMGHIMDFVHSTLSGEYTSFTAQTHIQRPRIGIRDGDGKVTETISSDVPDLVTMTGDLDISKGGSDSKIPLDVRLRRGPPFKGTPGLDWIITGDKGEIRITNVNGPTLNADDSGAKVEVYDFESDEVSQVDGWEEDEYAHLPAAARNIGRLYDLFAAAKHGGKGGERVEYPDFDHAVLRHGEIDGIFTSAAAAEEGG